MDKSCVRYNVGDIDKLKTNKKIWKILIVDDDSDSSELFKEILEERGHDVIVANEPMDCINNVKNNYFDVIFLDYHMDGLDGVQVADLIKDVLKNKSIIIACTGDSTSEAVTKFKEIQMDAAIIKPLDMTLLNSMMSSLEELSRFDRTIFSKLSKKFKNSLFVF